MNWRESTHKKLASREQFRGILPIPLLEYAKNHAPTAFFVNDLLLVHSLRFKALLRIRSELLLRRRGCPIRRLLWTEFSRERHT